MYCPPAASNGYLRTSANQMAAGAALAELKQTITTAVLADRA
jgi:hypothetical protein